MKVSARAIGALNLGGNETHSSRELYGGVEELVAAGGEASRFIAEEGRIVGAKVGDVAVGLVAEGGTIVAGRRRGVGLSEGDSKNGRQGEEGGERV